jgi:hypothetical protein
LSRVIKIKKKWFLTPDPERIFSLSILSQEIGKICHLVAIWWLSDGYLMAI